MKDKIKSLASDTGIYGVFRFLGKFISFLLIIVYSNAIEITEFAFLTYLFSFIAFLNVIFSFGMETAFFRFFKEVDDSKKVFSNSYFSILLVSLVISLIAISLSSYLINFLPTSNIPNPSLLFRLAFIIPFIDALMLIPNAYLRMTRKARKFALIQFFVVVVAVVLNIVFIVYMGKGAAGALYAQIIASTIGVVLLSPELIKNLIFKIDKELIKEMLRFGLPTVPAGLAAIILQVADRQIFVYITGNEMPDGLAIYGAIYRLGIPMMIFVSVFDYAWKPFYLNNYKDDNSKSVFARVLTYFTFISAIIFLLGSFYLEYLVRLPIFGVRFINPQYWEGLVIVPIILSAYYFNGLFYNFSAGLLIQKKTKFIPIIVGSGALINIGMNIYLIPKYDYLGAAWATLGAYVWVAIIAYIISSRIYNIHYEWRRLAILLLLTSGFYFGVEYITKEMDLWLSFATRSIAILLYLISIFISGFFNKAELQEMRNLIKRKNRI